jgi:hypothetical protein
MKHHGLNTQLRGGGWGDFSLTGMLKWACFIPVMTTLRYGLACAEIFHDGYKFVYHGGESCCEVWVHEKGRSDRTRDEMRAKRHLRFNRADLCKQDKKICNFYCVRCETRGRSQKCRNVGAHLEG